MLPAIQFNHEFLFPADEICHIATDWLLPYKFVTVELPVSEKVPQAVFCLSRIFAIAPGVFLKQ